MGGYNVLYRINFEGIPKDVMVRIPCPHYVQFPEEKTGYEVAAARYIEQNTQVPVPRVFYHGRSPDVGPYIILQYVEYQRALSHALTVPDQHPDTIHVLNHDISETTLEDLYGKVACYLLQLSQLKFPSIGSLVEGDGNDYSIAGRPITQNISNMIQLANTPRAVLPPDDRIYKTADEWYIALAEMHIAQLVFQQNDLVSSEDDCRNKYIARQLFHKLAKQGRLSTFGFAEDNWSAQSKAQQHANLSSAPDGSSSFRLWCDDLRPANILLNKSDDIAAIIDWEFTYSAPTQLILDPTWWLLLDVPEMWELGMDDWEKVYQVRLTTWLLGMKGAEKNSTCAPPTIPILLDATIHTHATELGNGSILAQLCREKKLGL